MVKYYCHDCNKELIGEELNKEYYLDIEIRPRILNFNTDEPPMTIQKRLCLSCYKKQYEKIKSIFNKNK